MRTSKLFLWSAVCLFAVLLGTVEPVQGQENVITLTPTISYQTITGWEATAEAGQTECSTFDQYKTQVFDQAVNDLGINRLRVEVRSGYENSTDYFGQFLNGQITFDDWLNHRYDIVNDNSNPNVINSSGFHFTELDHTMDNVVLPIKQRLEARGETLFINVTYVDFATFTGTHYNNPDEYAEFVLATYQHLQSQYGIIPDTWEIILEPDNSAWTGADIGRAIEATATRLQAAGYTPRFIAPSTTNMDNAPTYFDDMLNAAGTGITAYIEELSYHRYDGSQLGEIVSRANAHGLNISMLEHIGSGYQDLHTDLTVGQNSAWQQFTLAFCETDNAAQYYWIDESNPGNPQVNMGQETKFLRQYFKFIRRGAARIEATSNNGSFEPVAFINTGGNYVVVVKASTGGSFSIQGLPAGTYGIKYTTGSQYDVDLPEVILKAGEALNTSIPEAGVLTVYISAPILQVSDVDVPLVTMAGSGLPPDPAQVAITNAGTGELTWTASESTPWLTVTPMSGTAPSTLTFTADPTGLNPGLHTGQVTINSNGGAQVITVEFLIATDNVYLPLIVR